jgi:hypothetical protein
MSPSRTLPAFAAFFAALLIPAARAQVAEPSAYTIIEVVAPLGKPVSQVIYRRGPKAVIDQMNSAGEAADTTPHLRTVFDLDAHTSVSWDPRSASPACSNAKWSGDWGDPYAASGQIFADVASGKAQLTGTELVNGLPAKVYEETTPAGKMKAWMDVRNGLMLRGQNTPASGSSVTFVEVKRLSIITPLRTVFSLPASCEQAAEPKTAPTEADRIAAITGDNASHFSSALLGPASANSCTVLVRVVAAGSMQPISSGFQLGLDTTYDINHPPHYTYGLASNRVETFAGGGLHDVTSQLSNGVLRINNPPANFYLEAHWVGTQPQSGGLIYRQCSAPQTVLLYVVKDTRKPAVGGDWLWVKEGKFAAVGNPK